MRASKCLQSSIQEYFGELPEPRVQGRCRHQLLDVIAISLLAVLAGAEGWTAIETYGQAKKSWLSTFLALPHGIPSSDTFRRVLARLDPEAFEASFRRWIALITSHLDTQVIAMDGKTARGSYARDSNLKALQLVSAWASEHRLVLGQVRVEGKSNEITAIPLLLEQLDLKGSIVSLDAMGTQKDIARQIRQAQGDYILALKGNQGHLYQTAQQQFECYQHTPETSHLQPDYVRHLESSHHRLQKREVWVFRADSIFSETTCRQWSGLQSVVVVRSQRRLGNRTTHETRFFLSSRVSDAHAFARYIRSHWGIENSLHWCLDVVFAEDASRIRRGHAPRNFSLLRRLALNLLRQHPSQKSLKMKRYRAALDDNFLLEVLSHSLPQNGSKI